jgi:hypothetical protein
MYRPLPPSGRVLFLAIMQGRTGPSSILPPEPSLKGPPGQALKPRLIGDSRHTPFDVTRAGSFSRRVLCI